MPRVKNNAKLPKINSLAAFWLVTLLPFGGPVLGAAEELTGSALIVGNGPERYAVEALAKNFEAMHPKTSIDFFWHQNARPVEEVRENGADIGVTGQAEKDLPSTTVAWDGIGRRDEFFQCH